MMVAYVIVDFRPQKSSACVKRESEEDSGTITPKHNEYNLETKVERDDIR